MPAYLINLKVVDGHIQVKKDSLTAVPLPDGWEIAIRGEHDELFESISVRLVVGGDANGSKYSTLVLAAGSEAWLENPHREAPAP